MHSMKGTNICNAHADFLNRDQSRELPCPDMQIYRHCCISRISDCYVNATDCGKKKGGGGAQCYETQWVKILSFVTSAENHTDRTEEKTLNARWCKQAIQQCTVHTCTHAQNTSTLRAKFPTSNERSYLALGPSCSTAGIKWCSSILMFNFFSLSLASEPTKLKGKLESSLWGYDHNTARQPAPMTPFIH